MRLTRTIFALLLAFAASAVFGQGKITPPPPAPPTPIHKDDPKKDRRHRESVSANKGMSQATRDKIIRSLEQEMVFVKGGTYTSPETAAKGFTGTLSYTPDPDIEMDDFYIGHHITQDEWEAVTGSKAPSIPTKGNVNGLLIPALNRVTGKVYRLATDEEAQWASNEGKLNGIDNSSRPFVYPGFRLVLDIVPSGLDAKTYADAKLGNIDAAKKISDFYENTDNQEAYRKWLRRRGKMGDMTGYAKLGEVYNRPVYINGKESGLEDPINGEHYLSLALTGRVSSSEEKLLKRALGACRLYIAWKYYNIKDYANAFRWFDSAVKVGNTEAINMVGVCYYDGKGTSKDYTKAFKNFELAANQPDASVSIFSNLASCYYNGTGTEKDMYAAEIWYRKAAEMGDEASKEMVKRLTRHTITFSTPRTITVYCKWKGKRDVAIGCTLLIYRDGKQIYGMASDIDGKYYVNDLQKGDILEFSYVKHKTKRVKFTSNNIPEKLDIKLSPGDSEKIEYENL